MNSVYCNELIEGRASLKASDNIKHDKNATYMTCTTYPPYVYNAYAFNHDIEHHDTAVNVRFMYREARSLPLNFPV